MDCFSNVIESSLTVGRTPARLAKGGPSTRQVACRHDRLQTALLAGAWKLIVSNAGARELYRVDQDSEERKNLVGEMKERARILNGLFDE
jgi:hypothetical protein